MIIKKCIVCGNEFSIKPYRENSAKYCCKECRIKSRIGKATTIKHGKHDTRLYGIWETMKTRTTNPNSKGYKYYGGKGIKICSEWANDFMLFCLWAYNNGYKDNLTIDRIDNTLGYEPNNCRWTDMRTQGKKNQLKRTTAFIASC